MAEVIEQIKIYSMISKTCK